MANMNVEQMVEELSSWTVMDVANLVKALEEKWGVSAAPAAVAAGRASTVAVRTIRSLRITCMRTRIRRACSGAASIVAIRRGGPQRGV